MTRLRPAARAALAALALLALLAPPAPAPAFDLVESVRLVTEGSGALARNAVAKLLEKANEYGYEDIDVLARHGAGLKYPDGAAVRRLDATLALLDLALVATDKGAGYASFLFQNPLGRLLFQAIPYASGGHSLGDVLLSRLKRGLLRETLERSLLLRLLSATGGAHAPAAAEAPPLLGAELSLPRIGFDVPAARAKLRRLLRAARSLDDALSAELDAELGKCFPGVARALTGRLMDDLASGRALAPLLSVLRDWDAAFARANVLIGRAARLADAAAGTGATGERILLSVPRSLAELDRLVEWLAANPGGDNAVARLGREHFLLAAELAPADYARVRPFAERLADLRDRHGAEGIAFAVAYGAPGERFLSAMARPSPWLARRAAMLSFVRREGPGALPRLFRLGLLPSWEPALLLLLLAAGAGAAVRLLLSRERVAGEMRAMPARRKVALALLTLLLLAALYWTLVEDATLFIDMPRGPTAWSLPPAIPREADGWFATHLTALDSVETEFAAMRAAGLAFRTAEVDLFLRSVADLRSKYVTEMESFEVRLAAEPRLFENYAADKILTERDFLLEVTLAVRNLAAEPRLFPLTVELSTVLGNLVPAVEGANRLAKSTFAPGVGDRFTLTFAIRPEDRPDRIVVRKEHLVGRSEAFLDFGPGTPLRLGDLLAAKWGLLFPERLAARSTGEIVLSARLLAALDETAEVPLLARAGTDSGLFLVAADGRTFAAASATGDVPGFPVVPPNRIVRAEILFPVDPALGTAELPLLVVGKKKVLTEPYQNAGAIGATVDAYLRRLAAACEFEFGMYYYDPPLYRKWAKDLDMARRHFERAAELLPESEPVRQAVRLTRP